MLVLKSWNAPPIVLEIQHAEINWVPKFRLTTRYGNTQVAMLAGNRMEVPKSHSIAFTLGTILRKIHSNFVLCSYKIAGHFHDLAVFGTSGKKTGIVLPKAGWLAALCMLHA